jgi:hypothetical protein
MRNVSRTPLVYSGPVGKKDGVAAYGALIVLRPPNPELPLGAMDRSPLWGFFRLGAGFFSGVLLVSLPRASARGYG